MQNISKDAHTQQWNLRQIQAVIELNKLKYELVPPHDHQRNIAKKGILTFKDHLITILCITDKDCPLYLYLAPPLLFTTSNIAHLGFFVHIPCVLQFHLATPYEIVE